MIQINFKELSPWLIATLLGSILQLSFDPGPMVKGGDLVLEVSNIRNTNGEILIAMFNQPEGFPEDEDRFYRADTIWSISGSTERCVFRNLTFGEYAITLMHDENSDGKMEYSWIGMPQEGYGFSTNYRPKLRAPKFEETSFDFTHDRQIVKVELIY